MAEYSFRLQSIVQLRARERDAAAGSYQEALAARHKLQTQIEALIQEHASQRPVQSLSVVGKVDTQRTIEIQRYQMHLLQHANHLRSQLELVESECEKRRLILMKKEQALGTLDKLRSKQRTEWLSQQTHQEQIVLDQWAGFKYWEK